MRCLHGGPRYFRQGWLRPFLLRTFTPYNKLAPPRNVGGEVVGHHRFFPFLFRWGDDDDSLRLLHTDKLRSIGLSDPLRHRHGLVGGNLDFLTWSAPTCIQTSDGTV
ncbi:hypothetical protein ACSBR2_034609 [Camellia fascicularis]